MTEQKHKIKLRFWFYSWLKWLALALFILLLCCILFKCCTPFGDDRVSRYDDIRYEWYPDHPNRPAPIDTSMVRVHPDDPLRREVITDLINAYLQDSTDLKDFAANFVREFPADSIRVTYFAEEYQRVQFRVPPERRDSLSQALKKKVDEVKFVLDEWIIRNSMASIPSDPGFNDDDKKWFYDDIGLFNAWDSGYGSEDIIVAVLDDSFDPNHKELKGRIALPWNVVAYSDELNTAQDGYHGTHVAGTVAGSAENNFGISGVAPSCKIMPIQIGDAQGNISITAILDGIFYALKNDADVINLSLGQDLSKTSNVEEAEMWEEIYRIAEEENVTIVQAAGNFGVLAGIDPMKRSQNTVVVGAVGRDKTLADFSNIGEFVKIFAPGVDIYSSLPDNKFGVLDGTSMASPIVAGCVALIKSSHPEITNEELMKLILETGDEVDGDSGILIRVDKILAKLG
jgi:subtilisin family serine protease